MRSGYLFRRRNISRKIDIREYGESFLHAKNTCYTVLRVSITVAAMVLPNSRSLGQCRTDSRIWMERTWSNRMLHTFGIQ